MKSQNRQHALRAGAFLLTALLGPAPIALAQGAPVNTTVDAAQPYVLSPDDQVSISVLGHPDVSQSVTVLPDGTFFYPVVGTVHAAGLTVDGLTRVLTRGLADQLNQPQVTVNVLQSRPRKVSVLGAVKAPGQYDCRLNTHLLDILAACGGPAQDPVLTKATLVTDGGRSSQDVDVVALMTGHDPSLNVPLAPGDVLLVEARDVSVAQVQVVGEVQRPGAFTVPTDGAPMLSVLAQAGGPTTRAALTHAQIVHAGHTEDVDLYQLMNKADAPAGAFRLVGGDVLLVPANTARIAVMGEVRAPSVYSIPDGETLTVISALALAGGATEDGDSKSVDLVRRGADGKAQVTEVNSADLLRGKAGADLALQPGDILYVPTRHKGHSGADALQAIAPLGWISTMLGLRL